MTDHEGKQIDSKVIQTVPIYTQSDFLETTKPYEFLHQFNDDKFIQQQLMGKIATNAQGVKVRNFKALFKDYEKTLIKIGGGITDVNVTRFDEQEFELKCGAWIADDGGVSILMRGEGEVFACPHPIMPVMRLVNIDSNIEKLKIAYRKGKFWRSVIADKRTLASANSIVSLADNGIAVTSENSRLLVKYISELENTNYDLIPEKSSVSRLGWIDGEGFSPYVDGLVFDGEECFNSFFTSVSKKGSFDKWVNIAKEARKGDIPVRMILASSFASILVKKVEALSFFVHIWGSEAGIGKTVGLMFAASVWANPEMGKFIHTFNGTAVSQELSAGFVNSLPLILDEFQVLKDKKTFEQSVYMLAEGVGKGRGSKGGGVQRMQTWKNCILTNGEMPITNFMTGAGAFNRIVEIECEKKLFDNPQAILAIIRNNYGHAGKMFVEILQEDENMAYAQSLYEIYYNEIIKSETTDKQAMAGALLLTADRLATEWLFKDNRSLAFKDIAEHLQTKNEVDINERAYNFICETVASNINRFNEKVENAEIWGKLDSDNSKVFIIRNIFEKICDNGGYSSRAILSWLIRKELVEVAIEAKSNKKIPTVQKKISGNNVRCVCLELKHSDESIFGYIDELD